MSLFYTEKEEKVEGYVGVEKPIPAFFPVTRTITMRIFPYGNKLYFRTREAAALLGMKQQFQFVSDVSAYLGDGAILRGERTKVFRGLEDSNRVTFIEAEDLLQYLLNDSTSYNQKYAQGMYLPVVTQLQDLIRTHKGI